MLNKKFIPLFLFCLFLFLPTTVLNANSSFTLESSLPTWTDTEFKSSRIRIETFGKETCPYCQLLKENLYPALENHSGFNNVAARYLNMTEDSVKNYLLTIEEYFQLDDSLKGAIPATLINGTYLILGYNEQSTEFYLNLLERIQRGEEIEPDEQHYLYVRQSTSTDELVNNIFTIDTNGMTSFSPLLITLMFLIIITYLLYLTRLYINKKTSPHHN